MKLDAIGRAIGGVAAATLLISLAACLLSPGRFVSDLDVRKSGVFSFRYAGELVFLPMAEKPKTPEKFEPKPCYDDDGSEERECSAAELAEQKSAWQDEQTSKAEQEKGEAETAKAFFGGIDPKAPEAAAELADRLRRQAGWNKVEYLGNGVFNVEFAISGTLDHDFVFPTLERFPMANTFVQVSRRNDGTVRIDAPAFGPPPGPMALGGITQSAVSDDKDSPQGSDAPTIDGQFTIRTDAAILANNTDDGPMFDPAGQRLDWKVSARSQSAPTALLRLSK